MGIQCGNFASQHHQRPWSKKRKKKKKDNQIICEMPSDHVISEQDSWFTCVALDMCSWGMCCIQNCSHRRSSSCREPWICRMPGAPVEDAIVSLLVDTGGYYSYADWTHRHFCLVSSLLVVVFFLMFLWRRNIHTTSPSADKDLVCCVPYLKTQVCKRHNDADFWPLLVILKIKCCLNNTSHYLPVCIVL